MKKAKEYAKQYNDNPTDEELANVMGCMLKEVTELAETRGARTKGAYCAILDEQDRKWRAFVRQTADIVNPNGFEVIIEVKFPVVYDLWRGKWKDWQPQRSVFPEKTGRRGRHDD